MTLNQMHARRVAIRKLLIVGDQSEAELHEYLSLGDALLRATKPGTIGRGRVNEFIPGSVE